MITVFIKRFGHTHRYKTTQRHREKAAIDRPKEAPQKEPTLLTSWSWTSSFQGCEKINFFCLCHLVCGTLLGYPYTLLEYFFSNIVGNMGSVSHLQLSPVLKSCFYKLFILFCPAPCPVASCRPLGMSPIHPSLSVL